jgi:hypothetical protein
MTANPWLLGGGILSGVAAFVHVATIFGGPAWYRFLGAGEGMATLAARGSPKAALITLGIAAGLGVWSAYALSGAGIIPRLPLLRAGLIAISTIYVLRAAALPLMLTYWQDRGTAFIYWSSAIVPVLGLVHAIGTWTAWPRLAT